MCGVSRWVLLVLVLVLVLVSWLGACAQTDVIAVESPDDASASAACRARVCADFDALATRCADGAAHLVIGDGCSDSDPMRPASRFAVCTCSELVTTQMLTMQAWDSRNPGSVLATPASRGQGEDCACDSAQLLDVAALVAAHAADNDDAMLGVTTKRFDGFNASASDPPIALDCGRYYFDGIHGRGALRLHATGHVALFVAGDVALDDDLEVTLDAGAALDLFVSGNLRITGGLMLGTKANAPAARVYVAGSGTIDIGGPAFIAGALYAPHAELVTRGTLELYGSLFVRRAAPLGDVVIHYDIAAAAPEACELAP